MRRQTKVINQATWRPFLVGGAALAVVSILSGCHIDMWRQPKAKANSQSDFFADRQTSRPLEPGTVPQGGLRLDDAYHSGRIAASAGAAAAGPSPATEGGTGGPWVTSIPVEAVESFASPKAMLLRGKDRFNAFCAPCHGALGDGNGMITQRGLQYWQKLPASYHADRLRRAEDGYIYDVLTNGKGIMYGYGARIQDVNDRWAVVSYVRALQLAQRGLPSAEAAALRARWQAERAAAGAESGEGHGDGDTLTRPQENAESGSNQPGSRNQGGQDGGEPGAGPAQGSGPFSEPGAGSNEQGSGGAR
ncbi:MAG TPA: cytochrome c [Armatimonadaceae bacterium]|nr:cytochrome c [Armatimonadaceae bacterium]